MTAVIQYKYYISNIEKECSDCRTIKVLSCFTKNKNSPNGLEYACKECRKKSAAKCNKLNTEYRHKKQKEYYENNKEKIKESQREYYLNNKQKKISQQIKYQANKRKTDPRFKLAFTVRNRLHGILKLKKWNKDTKSFECIGCTREELMFHLEKQFKPGMNWNNHGEWHIDHIIPLSSAKTKEEVYKLSHYMNLQPLWAAENFSKGAR